MSLNGDQEKDFVLPFDTSSLIDALDRRLPWRPASIDELATEGGRIRYAEYLGKRALIDWLKGMQALHPATGE